MPKYRVELQDGRTFDVEADSQPTEDEILSALPREDNRSAFGKLWDKATEPLLPERATDLLPKRAADAYEHQNQEARIAAADVSPLAAQALSFAQDINPATLAYRAVRNFSSSPVDIALNAATLGGNALRNAGMQTGARVLRGVEAGLMGGIMGRGVEHAADTDASYAERAGGVLQAVLGGVGVRGALHGPSHVPAAVTEDVTELAGAHSPFADAADAVRPSVDAVPPRAGAPAPPMSWAERARYADEGIEIPNDRIPAENLTPEQLQVLANEQTSADVASAVERSRKQARRAALDAERARADRPTVDDLRQQYGARDPLDARDATWQRVDAATPAEPSEPFALNLTGDRAISEGEAEGINRLGRMLEDIHGDIPSRGNGLADNLNRPVGPMVERAYVNPRPGEAMAGPRDLTQMSAGEEEGIRSLGNLYDSLHGADAPTRGNGIFGRIPAIGERGAADASVLARMGLGAGGAAYGFATGDDMQSRLERAAIFGTAGALAPSMLSRPASAEGMLDTLAKGKNISRVEGITDVLERGGKPSTAPVAKGVAPTVAGDTGRAEAFIDRHIPLKNPEDLNLAKQILSDSDNFYKQRRMSRSWQQTEAAADDLAVDDLRKMLPKGTTLNAEQIEAYRRASMGAVGEMNEASAALKAAGDQATDAMRFDAAEKTLKAVTGMASMFGTRSEAGRALNIYKKFAVARRQGDVGFARKLLERGIGAEEVAQHLQSLSGDPLKQMQFLRSMSQPKFGDYWRWYMLSNILSGPVTHARNVGGNVAEGATMFGGRAVGEILSSVKGGPQRLVAPGETVSAAEGAVKGLGQAWKNAAFFFNNGFSPRDAEAFKDIPAEVFGGNKFANVVGRGLGAMDQFFQGINFSSELYALARRKAYNEGLRGSRLAQRADELVAQPTDEIIGEASKFAQRAVFRDKGGELTSLVTRGVKAVDNKTATIGQALAAKIAPTVGIKPARFFGEVVSLPFGTMVMPFVNTPASILRHGAKTMGVGFVTGASKLGKSETAREGLQDIGEAAIGAAVMGGAALLAAQGRLTGAAPSDPREREKWYAEGKRPNSVLIGDKWVSFNSLGRMTLPLNTVANAYDIYNKTGRFDPGLILATTAKAQLDSSYLSGIASIFDAIHEGGRRGPDGEVKFPAYQRVLGNITGSFLVPASGLMRGARRAVDPAVRAPEGISENIQNTIPGLSQNVTPRIDSAGNIPQFPAGLTGTGVERMLSPFDVSQSSPDPVRGAMQEVGEYLPTPSQTIKGLNLSDEQGVRLGQVMGRFQMEAVKSLVGSHRFYAMTPDQRKAAIERVVSDTRAQVREIARSSWQANTERP